MDDVHFQPARADWVAPGDLNGSDVGANGSALGLSCGLIEDALDVHTWATLDIPPVVRLLGELITPGSRTFLVGTTGVGKTMLAYEFAAAMASGTGFLHWRCDRPARVLVIDGEMPDALIKQRTNEILRRYQIPPANLLIYSLGRAEKLAKAGLPVMPPLNTEAGHKWVIECVEEFKPEVVIFDNLMSLAPGDHSKAEAWLPVSPLVMKLSSLNLAQIWCDHSGWDTSRQFGTSTKAWGFDTVGILKPPPEEQREIDALTVSLTFDTPGKCRRRTPSNRHDFEAKTLTLRDTGWTAGDATTAPRISAAVQGWLKDIQDLFAVPDLPQARTVTPNGVSCVRNTVSRDELRNWLRKCGRIGDGSHAPLTDKDRSAIKDKLNALRKAGKVGVDGDYVWLT